MTAPPPTPGLEPACEVDVELGPPEHHGMTRAGHRRVVPIAGGAVHGAIEGRIRPGGTSITIEPSAHPAFEHGLYIASCIRDANRVRYLAYRVT